MNRVLVLGGYGLLGRQLVAQLIATTAATIVVAGRRLSPATTLCRQLDPHRCQPRVVDATDLGALSSALRECDVALNCLDGAEHLDVLAMALSRTKRAVIDLTIAADRTAVWARHASALRDAGTYAVIDAGAQPGTPALVARRLLERSKAGHDLRVAAMMKVRVPPDAPMPSAIVDAIARLVVAPKVYRPPKWRTAWLRYLWPFQRVRFRAPFGPHPCATAALPEIRALRHLHPKLTRIEFAIGGANALVRYLWFPLLRPVVGLIGRASHRPAAWLLYYAGLRLFSGPPFGVAVRAELTGPGYHSSLELQHDDAYGLTVVAALACLAQIRDRPPGPGIHMMGTLLQPSRFERDTTAMGARWLAEETSP